MSDLRVSNVMIKSNPAPHPCPRCERELVRVEASPDCPNLAKTTNHCPNCKTSWLDPELAEAWEEVLETEPCSDVEAVFREEGKRGKRKGGGGAGKVRRKPAPFSRSGLLVDDWNLGQGWAEGKLVDSEKRIVEIKVRFPDDSKVVALAKVAGVRMCDLIRAGIAAKLEELSRKA